MAERSSLYQSNSTLPDSSVAQRVDGGKLVGAAQADLTTGIVPPDVVVTPAELEMPWGDDANTTVPENGFGGFLRRTHGWDR